MSLKTSNLPFKVRVDHEVHNTIMRKAVVKAQETIGANRQKMVDELGHWEEWRDLSKQIRNHVLANLDAYLYQLSEKVIESSIREKCEENRKIQIHGDRRNRFKRSA